MEYAQRVQSTDNETTYNNIIFKSTIDIKWVKKMKILNKIQNMDGT